MARRVARLSSKPRRSYSSVNCGCREADRRRGVTMYTLLRSVGFRKSLIVEAPSLAVSMLVAEVYYKFHSFGLECAAFLLTWTAVSYTFSRAGALLLTARARPRA